MFRDCTFNNCTFEMHQDGQFNNNDIASALNNHQGVGNEAISEAGTGAREEQVQYVKVAGSLEQTEEERLYEAISDAFHDANDTLKLGLKADGSEEDLNEFMRVLNEVEKEVKEKPQLIAISWKNPKKFRSRVFGISCDLIQQFITPRSKRLPSPLIIQTSASDSLKTPIGDS